jgi:prepilin-type N-terminal cleavage/methylation domain-containing protein
MTRDFWRGASYNGSRLSQENAVNMERTLRGFECTPGGRRGAFTLIELLVVIAIIALLMAILMPSLNKARKQARSAVCLAHLRQWGTVFHLYTSDNNSRFWTEQNVWATGRPQGNWMLMLSAMYGNVDKARLCPSASRLNGPQGGVGTTYCRWGPGPIMVNHRFIDEPDKVYGSYGINFWINSVEPPSTGGWRGQPQRQWKTIDVKHSAQIPMVSDCTWFGANPYSLNDSSYSVNAGKPTPVRDWWESKDPIGFAEWDWDMARYVIDRHGRGINVALMDGSSQKVYLQDLWSLKWHREFELVYDVEIPWLN